RKLLGVLGSLAGIVLVSKGDLSSRNDGPGSSSSHPKRPENDGSNGGISHPFPAKSPEELLLGDGLALLSAVIYGVYTITLKSNTIRARPLVLNMPLFFGLVGLFNTIFLLPLFPILHWTGLERFQFPPTRRIWTILLVNSASGLLSDLLWAYALLLTSPL